MKRHTMQIRSIRQRLIPAMAIGVGMVFAPTAVAQPVASSAVAFGAASVVSPTSVGEPGRSMIAQQRGRGSNAQAAPVSSPRTQTARTQTARTQTARTQTARTRAAREETARIQTARTQSVRTEAARTEAARIEAARTGDESRRRAFSMSGRESALQQRLEAAGVLPRMRADQADEPLRRRLEAAGALPRYRASMAELRDPSRQVRSPRLRTLASLERNEVMREMFNDVAKHRMRLAQLDRLGELARLRSDAARTEEVDRLREVERARHRRLIENGDAALGDPGTFSAVVDELETGS
ncbi:hypothetical protein [Engelhardtia mirabilis]|uniref:Uncharacterized protein n=1 Tax=Engelhardtia mirabilis TaxID=2528011 RepID=A0A518BS61_9BACT|nr:hypothetical protein Pla133_49280 [Planctomycetes bacterium Pla133]QDV04132.1 hypothetical protein Pla86_49260 [Planctomycetes bacterium Pla86]